MKYTQHNSFEYGKELAQEILEEVEVNHGVNRACTECRHMLKLLRDPSSFDSSKPFVKGLIAAREEYLKFHS